MKQLISSLLLGAVCTTAAAATVVYNSIDHETLAISLEGSIEPSDARQISQILARHPKHSVRLNITSNGGEIAAAIAIGRQLRARDAMVNVLDQCHSSCVLIYSAGVERKNPAESARLRGDQSPPSTGIGIHQFYFLHVSPNATSEEITAARNKQKNQIRAYLSDMNVSAQLLDAMEAIPPERMRILKTSELHQYGLGPVDPVFDEKRVAREASLYKLTSAEFRKREAAAKRHCAQAFLGKQSKTGTLPDIDFNCEPNFIRSGGQQK